MRGSGGRPDLRVWGRDGKGGAHELKVPETVSLAERTAASMSKGSGEDEEASERVAAYEFQSERRDGCDSAAVPEEAAVPPVNQACAVLCIAAAAGLRRRRRGAAGRAGVEADSGGKWEENDGTYFSRKNWFSYS